MGLGWRVGDGRWSRRRLIGALALAGGGALLSACGGSVATPTVAPTNTAAAPTVTSGQVASTPTVAAASPTRPGPPATQAPPAATPGTPAGTPLGTPGVGTPTRPGSPVAATPAARANPTLARMLALVPQVEPLPGLDGIWFADIAAQKRNYGFGDVTSAEAFERLTEGQRLTFNNTMAGLPIAEITGRAYALQPEWREVTGYDFWQVERLVQAGSAPQQWARLEGRFDRAAIAAALAEAGHTPGAYQEATILARGADGQNVNLGQPFTRYTLARLNRVVLEEGALAASSQTALAEAGIDVRAGRRPSFAADADYAALAQGLGLVVGAMLLPPEAFTGAASSSARPTATRTPSRTATVAADRLPPYSKVGLGLRDDGRDHAMVIALVYGGMDEARTAATVLSQRLMSYRLTVSGQQLSERAEPGDAEIVTVGDRAVVTVPLKVSDEPSLSLWQRMYANRDYGFLMP